MYKLLIEKGFSDSEAKGLCCCLDPYERTFEKGEIIFGLSGEDEEIGIILRGTAALIGVNSEGQNSVIDFCGRGDSFGRHFFPHSGLGAFYAAAKSKCVIAHISYRKLITCCENRCDRHVRLIDMLTRNSIRKLQAHIDILSQRSIRGKLICYFEYTCRTQNRNSFELPFSLSDLADYLAVDRSAMMRELRKLNDDGTVRSSGKKILVLRHEG